MSPAPRVIWAPSRTQRALLSCPVEEVFFGGSRGGGKTDGMLGEWSQHAQTYAQHAIGLMIRRTAKQLGETFERSKVLFGPLGAKFVGTPESGGMRVTMPNGARLIFGHLERDADAEAYMGGSYTRVYVEEAGNFPSQAPIAKLWATLRSGQGVPCRMRLTGNPGGPGHQWLRARYIDPAPLGWQIITDEETGRQRVYIPSRVSDNPSLDQAAYVANLKQSGTPELVRAWLLGDWSVIAGAFFPEFNMGHVLPTFAPPAHWLRFRSMDWGSSRPFAVGWWTVSEGHETAAGYLPRGALVKYREWYGSNGQPNVGLKLTAEEIAAGIRSREKGDTISYGVADPAMFATDGGPSHAERMFAAGVAWRPADNKRVARLGAVGGWDVFRQRLKGLDGRPMVYWMDCCRDAIRCIPVMQHDSARPEDLDSEAEDHVLDADRYAMMSRPWTPPVVDSAPERVPGTLRISDFHPAKRAGGRV